MRKTSRSSKYFSITCWSSRAEVVVRLFRARCADDGEVLRQQAAERKRVERREELPLRQVAGGAEDDHRARVRRAPDLEPLEEGIVLERRRCHRHRGSGPAFPGSTALIACPPNWF